MYVYTVYTAISGAVHPDLCTLTSAQSNFDESHPVGLGFHIICLELQDLAMREEDLEVAVATRSNRDDIFHRDTIFEGALSRVEDEELI